MKANELMIGDYVTFKDSIECDNIPMKLKIVALGYQHRGEEDEALVQIDDDNACDIINIDNEVVGYPLTPEILENNGWKLYEPSTKMYIKSNSNLAVCFPPHSDKVQVYYVVEHLRTIKYVHEFQHILWALGMDADLKIPDERKEKGDDP